MANYWSLSTKEVLVFNALIWCELLNYCNIWLHETRNIPLLYGTVSIIISGTIYRLRAITIFLIF